MYNNVQKCVNMYQHVKNKYTNYEIWPLQTDLSVTSRHPLIYHRTNTTKTRYPSGEQFFYYVKFITTTLNLDPLPDGKKLKFWICFWILKLIKRFWGNSEGGVGLSKFVYVDWCRKHPKWLSGGRFMNILECQRYLLLIIHFLKTNWSIWLRQPPLNLDHGVHLKHQNVI